MIDTKSAVPAYKREGLFLVFSSAVESVLKRRVQFYLIASVIARVHGKVRSLSKS